MLALTAMQRRSALLGHLVGDAVGVPYEFNPPQRLPARELLDMQPPPGFRRTYPQVSAGTWSDDGALLLALLDSLRHSPELDLEDLARRMHNWESLGWYTPDGRVFDIGVQTLAGLHAWREGTPAHESGPAAVRNNGNGSLMRTLACVLVPATDREQLVDRALRQGLPTHGHARSRVTCALYALLAWELAQPGCAWHEALDRAHTWLQAHLQASLQAELELLMAARSQPPQGSGYVVDSFWSAWHCLSTTASYKDCIQAAVALGNDTDTTACIAGGLAGLVHGEAVIPRDWLDGLLGKADALAYLEDPA